MGSFFNSSGLGNASDFWNVWFNRNTKVTTILSLVKNKYVDSVNVDLMEDLAVNQILNKLDPHSSYLTPADTQQQNESLEGSFEGIGIEYLLVNDTILITGLRTFGPAQKAGILPGDKIIAVNSYQKSNQKTNSATMLKNIRGKKGTQVKVMVLRQGFKKQLFTLVRDKIVVSSIDAAYPIDSKTGYIKISKFGANTGDDFLEELQKMSALSIKNIILDLRDNGGGYLNAAIEMADQFLVKNKLIVYTQGLHEPRTYYNATDIGLFEHGKLAILIDENTASASEIVAGAIQDWGRGVIIGRRSFGKGLVQQQFVFNDGSAINLTIARYFTPTGRLIQKSYKNGKFIYNQDLDIRLKKGQYTSLDSSLADTTVFTTTSKFKTAKGKIVHAGGGIMPDVFIPLDTLYHSSFYNKVISKSLISNFVFAVLIHQINSKQYLSANHFIASFNIQNKQYQNFINYCKQFKVLVTAKEIEYTKPLILKNMKSILVKHYYGEQAFYRYINQYDACLLAALQQFGR